MLLPRSGRVRSGHAGRCLSREGGDFASKAQVCQFIEECGIVVADLREEAQVFRGIAERLDKLKRVLYARDQQVGSAKGSRASVEIKGSQAVASCAPGDKGRVW